MEQVYYQEMREKNIFDTECEKCHKSNSGLKYSFEVGLEKIKCFMKHNYMTVIKVSRPCPDCVKICNYLCDVDNKKYKIDSSNDWNNNRYFYITNIEYGQQYGCFNIITLLGVNENNTKYFRTETNGYSVEITIENLLNSIVNGSIIFFCCSSDMNISDIKELIASKGYYLELFHNGFTKMFLVEKYSNNTKPALKLINSL
jgi:hypothetical protein